MATIDTIIAVFLMTEQRVHVGPNAMLTLVPVDTDSR